MESSTVTVPYQLDPSRYLTVLSLGVPPAAISELWGSSRYRPNATGPFAEPSIFKQSKTKTCLLLLAP